MTTLVTCERCDGWGYTRKERPEFKEVKKGRRTKLKTVSQGSGCKECYGVGYKEE